MGQHLNILGGGVIGLSVAFECARRGHRVTLLEQGACGGQASGAAAGMLAPFSENGEGAHDFFRLCLESLRLYPDWQQEVKDASGCSFEYSQSGSLFTAIHDADLLGLMSRRQWQSSFGSEPELVEGEALRRVEPGLSESVQAALFHPDEAHLYAPDYVYALEQACRSMDVGICEHLGELKVRIRDQGAEALTIHDPSGKRYEGDKLIICSGAWTGLIGEHLGLRLPVYPIRGQICAYDMPLGSEVRHMVFGNQGYVVPKASGTLVCGASEDIAGFDASVTERGIARLLNWNKMLFPFLEKLQPSHRWAGLRPATQDGYPLLGEVAGHENVLVAAGHYRNGILLSPVTAKIIADLIDDKPPGVAIGGFHPNRFGIHRSSASISFPAKEVRS